MATATKQEVLRLHFEDNRIVFVEGKDEDRFILTMSEAIRACKAYDSCKEHAFFSRQYKNMLSRLKNWVSENKDVIDRAFLTVQDSGLSFLTVTKTRQYDDEFEERLSDLDLEIARSKEFSLIGLNVQSLPNCGPSNYLAFCDPDNTLEF